MQTDNWLEIPDDSVDAAQIQRQIEQRLAHMPADDDSPAEIMATLHQQMLGSADDTGGLPPLYEADIVPRSYTINWRNPILGPLNAILRRFVNLELRRSIYSALEQQSTLNRQILQELIRLRTENKILRQRIESIRRQNQ